MTLMSNMCPVPSQGSLVMTTSPGDSVSGGNRFSMCCSVAGAVPVKDGTL